ncbi:uncharacterized protein LOC128032475 isoform X2 [Gossypium raimondii]|uniref:uncharacterized protein LOC128032475 isoform X2 n=1 Tax=Gossypium raimondii TaxID=29730 RepID=UPI00227AE8B2|nr:uncharacterized protein LOC128032475 isoform X2 [Gossypium raimondii]
MLDSFFNMSLLLNNPQTTTNWEIRLKMDEVGGKELAENLEILTTKAKPRHCITLREMHIYFVQQKKPTCSTCYIKMFYS